MDEDLRNTQSSEARLQRVLNSVSEQLIAVDSERRIILWNECAASCWQRPEAEVLGHDVFEVLPEIVSVGFKAGVDEALKEDKSTVLENLRVARQGSEYFYRVQVAPFEGGASICLTDISDRCKLQESHTKLTEVLETATDFVAYADADGRVTYLNEAFRKAAGIVKDENISKHRLRDFHPKWPHNGALADAKINLSGDQVWSGEGILLTRKEELPLAQVIVFHKDRKGTLTHISSIARDISTAKRAEKRGWEFAQELRSQQEKFETLVNSVEGIVWEAGADSKLLTFVSQRAERILGYASLNWLEVPDFWASKLHPDDRATVLEHRRRGVADRKNYVLEYRMIAADGHIVWIRDYTNVSREEDKPTLLRGILLDISEQKKADAELERLNKELVETSRMAGMAEVATGVLHNVGNVLNSVNVTVTLVRDSLRKSEIKSLNKVAELLQKNDQNIGQYLTTDPKGKMIPGFVVQVAQQLTRDNTELQTECDQLAGNIEHIKEIVSMQQSYARVSGCMETVSATSLIENSFQINAESFSRHGIEVIREFSDVPPVIVDKHKVLQILINLVNNAKHSLDDCGRADKKLRVGIGKVAGSDRVTITIKDNGVGIPPENLTKIFSHGFTTKVHGHGFGLHSGANAAKEMGGMLSASSEGPGKGATFTLELPTVTPK